MMARDGKGDCSGMTAMGFCNMADMKVNIFCEKTFSVYWSVTEILEETCFLIHNMNMVGFDYLERDE